MESKLYGGEGDKMRKEKFKLIVLIAGMTLFCGCGEKKWIQNRSCKKKDF